MTTAQLNFIGLEVEQSAELAAKLNDLLSNYQIFYQNARGFHWNVRGEKFFELHLKFEELYTNALVKIDEIAERILTLGHTPVHTFTDYVDQSTIQPARNISNGRDGVNHVLRGFQVLLEKEREILEMSGDLGDEGTNALMSDYIREQEKLVWMYAAYLG